MPQDLRLNRMLHVLVHMGVGNRRETSVTIAKMLGTSAPAVRRTMGFLRESGIVSSEGGKNGGWKLTRRLSDLTALDVQRALQIGPLLATPASLNLVGNDIESSTNKAIATAYQAAEEELIAALGALRLSDIAIAHTHDVDPPVGS
ncbi:Rrf2 family transcriptional regulator [Rhizobium sp. Rhizsp82]|uniref:Rrf2 family transcriptional regulator n=1 Tax=Rhizobium sp. Rhizsp82 TaxID=3243057 RepID=UPI0039B481E5